MRASSYIPSPGHSAQALLWGPDGSSEIRCPNYRVVYLVAHSAPLTPK